MKRFCGPEFRPDAAAGHRPLVVHGHSEQIPATMLLLIHGLSGQRYGTWGRFPEFLFTDHPAADVGLYSYRSGIARLGGGRTPELWTEAMVLADELREAPYSEVHIVAHSMGGLLAKAALAYFLKAGQAHELDRVRSMHLLASPQLGTMRVPTLLSGLTKDTRALRSLSDVVQDQITILTDHGVSFLDQPADGARHSIPTCAVIADVDAWVQAFSASHGLPASQVLHVRGTHRSVAKPRSGDDEVYQFVNRRIRRAEGRPEREEPPEAETGHRRRQAEPPGEIVELIRSSHGDRVSDFRGVTFAGGGAGPKYLLRGLSFDALRLGKCQLHNLKFQDCRFDGAEFDNCRFMRVDFHGCSFEGSGFYGGQVAHTHVSGTGLRDVTFKRTTFKDVVFVRDAVKSVRFVGAEFQDREERSVRAALGGGAEFVGCRFLR